MQIDYKITGIHRDGKQTVVDIVLYKGAVTTEDENVGLGKLGPVTRYRRTAILDERTYKLNGDYPDEKVRDAMNLILDEESDAQQIDPISVQQVDPAKVAQTPTPTLVDEPQ